VRRLPIARGGALMPKRYGVHRIDEHGVAHVLNDYILLQNAISGAATQALRWPAPYTSHLIVFDYVTGEEVYRSYTKLTPRKAVR
jgi:hypothetical protein